MLMCARYDNEICNQKEHSQSIMQDDNGNNDGQFMIAYALWHLCQISQRAAEHTSLIHIYFLILLHQCFKNINTLNVKSTHMISTFVVFYIPSIKHRPKFKIQLTVQVGSTTSVTHPIHLHLMYNPTNCTCCFSL